MQRARQSFDELLGDRTPTFDDLAGLGYIGQVLRETLRMHPTAPAFGLTPSEATTLGGYAGPGRTSNRMTRVLDLLQADPGRQWRAREIAGLLGDVTFRQLARRTKRGHIKRIKTGRYTATPPTTPSCSHPPTEP